MTNVREVVVKLYKGICLTPEETTTLKELTHEEYVKLAEDVMAKESR